MQERLALPAPAIQIAALAMFLQLGDVSPDGAPSFDLSQIVRMSPPGIVSAIPLEPAARIVGMNPAFVAPDFQRLRCVDPKTV